MAALTWPLPPSTMTRSGIAQRRASSPPSSPVRDGPEPAAQDLLVAGEVVRAADRLDPEPPVLAGARLAVLEDDHAADRFAALEVADVVALDAQRRPGQAERLGQLLERGQRLAVVGQPARLLAGERLAGVPRGEREELPLLAALRDAEVDRPAAALGQERLEDRRRRRSPTARTPRAGSSRRARSTARGSSSRTSSSVASRAASSRKTSRPIILPSRITNSWMAAWLSWRAMPTRSSSVRAKAAIFWLSIVRSMARILSRRAAARSYSVRSAAAAISRRAPSRASPGDPRGRARPARCRRGSRPCAMALMHGPWQRLMWYRRHGRWRARSPSLMSIVQVRNGKSRRTRFIDSSTLDAEAYGPK